MPPVEFRLPINGVSDQTPYIKQPGDTTDPDALLNVVADDVATGRGRLSTRAKLTTIARDIAGPGRGLGSIPRASGTTGTQLGEVVSDTVGASADSGVLRAQFFVLNSDGGLHSQYADTRGTGVANPPTGEGGYGGFYTCWHATDAAIGYVGTIARNTTLTTQDKVVCGLQRIDISTRTITHSQWLVDAAPGYSSPLPNDPPGPEQRDLLPNEIIQHGPYLFVAVAHYVYVFNADDLTYIQRHAIDWALEVQCIRAVTRGGVSYLLTACTGNRDVSGAVVADSASPVEYFGEHYRSAVAIHTISTTTSGGAVTVGGTVLTRRAMPMGISSGAGYEDHRTFRLSEYSRSRPRGRLIYGMDTTTLGDVVVTTANQGWGYDGFNVAGHRPDGAAPYLNVARVVLDAAYDAVPATTILPGSATRYGPSAAVGGWEVEVGSLRRSYSWNAATYFNDIPALVSGFRDPQATNNEPAVWAVAIDETAGAVYVAGRRGLTTGGSTVYALDLETGLFLWEFDTVGIVQQNGIQVDPSTGRVVVAMIRSIGVVVDGTPSTAHAEVVWLNPETGEAVRIFSFPDAIRLNSKVNPAYTLGAFDVDVNASGQVLVALSPFVYDE